MELDSIQRLFCLYVNCSLIFFFFLHPTTKETDGVLGTRMASKSDLSSLDLNRPEPTKEFGETKALHSLISSSNKQTTVPFFSIIPHDRSFVRWGTHTTMNRILLMAPLSLSLYIATNQSCSANDLVASLRHATLHLSTLEWFLVSLCSCVRLQFADSTAGGKKRWTDDVVCLNVHATRCPFLGRDVELDGLHAALSWTGFAYFGSTLIWLEGEEKRWLAAQLSCLYGARSISSEESILLQQPARASF